MTETRVDFFPVGQVRASSRATNRPHVSIRLAASRDWPYSDKLVYVSVGGGEERWHMPSTVSGLLREAGVERGGAVRWGSPVPAGGPGVYVASLHRDPESDGGHTCRLSAAAIERLLLVRPEVRVDGARATDASVGDRLLGMWLRDEPVLYVGKATDLRSRIGQYYGTPIGARSPHAGGWPIKMIEGLPDLWVHFGGTGQPEKAEALMLSVFVEGVSAESLAKLVDPSRPYPYANLTGPRGRKRHGIDGAKGLRPGEVPRPESGPPSARTSAGRDTPVHPPKDATGSGGYVTQRITARDIGAGQVRIPALSKRAFPKDKGVVCVELGGERLATRWDPRMVPKPRSGVLGIGRAALTNVVPGTVMTIHVEGGCFVLSPRQ